MKGFSVPKNAGKELAQTEQDPRAKDFRYLKAGITLSMALAMEALNAGQANEGSKAVRVEARDVRVATYSAGASAPGVVVTAAGTKVANFADSRPKER